MTEEGGRVWVFGVVPAGADLKQLSGREDLPEVAIIESEDLAAMVGDAPEDDPKATRNQALGHARVLEAAVRDAPVVPMRFGIMCGSDEEVTSAILQERHDQFAELLDRFEDRVEMVLKAYYREEPLLREIVESEPEVGKLREAVREEPEEATREQRMRLGELINQAIEQRRELDSADLLGKLEEAVQEVRSDPPEKELMVLNVPMLVERNRVDALEATVEEVAEERREMMHFKLLGPMPAYHFLEPEETAPA
jgi:hypothetical protein